MKFTKTDKPNTPGPFQTVTQKPPAGPQDKTNSNLRTHITYILVITWVIIVMGKAFGLIGSDFQIDALLVASVGVVFGYLYGVSGLTDKK